ncbi:MAG: hypothetical protein SWJ54_12500, partial [Cyanobacteriota bacterium]|nr:hypothetical protein [Cyanobacteriota bacterium]
MRVSTLSLLTLAIFISGNSSVYAIASASDTTASNSDTSLSRFASDQQKIASEAISTYAANSLEQHWARG